MKDNRRRARAIAVAATEKGNRERLESLGYLTGAVLLAFGLLFSLLG